MDYLADPANGDSEFHTVMEKAWKKQNSKADYSFEARQGLNQIWNKIEERKPKSKLLYPLLKYAAAVLVVISAAFGWYAYKKHKYLLLFK